MSASEQEIKAIADDMGISVSACKKPRFFYVFPLMAFKKTSNKFYSS
ncbi:MAG: hypothetical protein KGV50_07885 [Gammaproteobacteria bacterium]|nr:hypothetical protein [Gammaproteobacteria bacterium]